MPPAEVYQRHLRERKKVRVGVSRSIPALGRCRFPPRAIHTLLIEGEWETARARERLIDVERETERDREKGRTCSGQMSTSISSDSHGHATALSCPPSLAETICVSE